MTPTTRNNLAYTRFATAITTEDQQVGQRTNRKRVRHRPRSRGKRGGETLRPSPIQPAPMAPTAMSVRYSYAGHQTPASRVEYGDAAPTPALIARKAWHYAPQSKRPSMTQSGQCVRKREDLWEREMRIFGGCGDEAEYGGEDLKAPMLDVVLGLFDGLDYDDDACC